MDANSDSQTVIIKQLLRDTLVMLCKNTLAFQTELSIEGLLGLTLDKNEIILVSIREIIGRDGSTLGDANCNVDGQTVSSQPNLTAKKEKKRKITNNPSDLKFSKADNFTVNAEPCDSNIGLPNNVNISGDSMRIEVDFDFEKTEIKEEEEEDVANGNYSDYDYSNNVQTEDHEMQQRDLNVETEHENDCYIESAEIPRNNYEPSDFRHSQNDPSDGFTSLDQKIFQEMFQADFASSSLTYNVDGFAGRAVDAPGRSTIERQVCRRRTSFGRPDGRRSTSHRQGYRFHCRYGYSRILHQCSQCSATFTMSSNLGRHMATMHNMNGSDQSVFCPMCQKRFSRSDNLARHLKKVHKCDSPHLTLANLSN